ncbi:MAG: type II toxin-antitoxin system RelE/ParE family toxin [Thermoanaerobaculia bacterium]
MKGGIRLSRAAQHDIATAKQWYAQQDVKGLDLRFRYELDQIFQQIEAFPAGYPVAYKDVRRANLHRFPYAVFYHSRDNSSYVIAVCHQARHPGIWKRRR